MNNESRLRIPPLAAIGTATAFSPPPTAGPMDRAVDAVVRRVDVDSGAFADQQDFAVDQRLRNLGPGPRQNAAEGDPRHPHRFCGRLVVETHQIRQPQCFDLVGCENKMLEVGAGPAHRLETGNRRPAGDSAETGRSWHITNICS